MRFIAINIVVIFIVLLYNAHALAQRPFVTVWDTNPQGANGPLLRAPQDKQIIFPGVGHNYIINWMYIGYGPTLTGAVVGNNATRISLPMRGKYRLWVTPGNGTFHRFNTGDPAAFNDVSNRSQLLEVEQWGDIRWSSMANAFMGCRSMDVTALDVPDLSIVTDLSRMFESCNSLLGNSNFYRWNTSNVRLMSHMFVAANLFNQPIYGWNTSNVVDMAGMFKAARSFNQYIGSWNTSKVYNMADMFNYATSFNQTLYPWNTGNVTNMERMFYGAIRFSQPMDNWNTANVTNMQSMFEQATSFNQRIGAWNTGKVTTMKWMFHKATAFNQPINTWNTSSVTNIEGMFTYATSFNQPLNAWNTANITTMAGTFAYATAFNQALNNWNTSRVKTMQWMFQGARSFNQSLGMWNITNVTNMGTMLSFSGLSTMRYDHTLLGWGAQQVKTRVTLGADGLTYCRGEDNGEGRVYLKHTYLWTIVGDRYDCSNWCHNCRTAQDSLAETNQDTHFNEKDISNAKMFYVYPNPANDFLFLKTKSEAISAYSITDIQGRIILSGENQARSWQVAVDKVPEGIYYFRIKLQDGRSHGQKVMIAH